MNKKVIWVIGIVLFIALATLFTSNVNDILEEDFDSTQIVGVWQSVNDSLSVREFVANGSLIEIYDGEVIGEGDIWQLSLLDGVTYLSIDSLRFEVVEVDDEKLTLIYLDRGNTLEYLRIK